MSQRHHLGDATLDLLTDECTLAIVSALTDGPVCARDVAAPTQGITQRTVQRRLHALALAEFVSPVDAPSALRHERGCRGPPGVWWALSDLGREYLLAVTTAASSCERTWCPPPAGRLGAPPVGLWVLGLVSDHYGRELIRALADGSLGWGDLRVHLPQIKRTTLRRHLVELCESAILVREQQAGDVLYSLTDSARHLTIVPVCAARCEWRRAGPSDSALHSDLPGLVHMLAPLGHIPRQAIGTCHWHVDSGTVSEPDIYLAGAAGRIAALTAPGLADPQAFGQATAEVWCDALMRSDPSMIATTGDRELFNAMLRGLSIALLE